MFNHSKYYLICILSTLLLSCSSKTDFTNNTLNNVKNPVKNDAANGIVRYLGNEALMIEYHDKKILFDPFFHNAFNTYQLVPEDIREALFSGSAPYDKIDVIFISHAHGDHFSAEDVRKFLSMHPQTLLVAPQQAIELLGEVTHSLTKRLHPINLEYQDAPQTQRVDGINFDVVRIPHAGWPQRAAVSNLVYRVSLSDEMTVVHMGDADPNDEHFKPLMEHWNKRNTNTAFPPYWFFMSESGQLILSDRIRAKENIGVHVPIMVPFKLEQSGEKYFHEPGEVRTIK